MKLRYLLPFKKFFTRLGKRGQSLVEFVLLLMVISGISWGFVALMNRNLAKYWEYYANLIVDDKPGTKTVKLE